MGQYLEGQSRSGPTRVLMNLFPYLPPAPQDGSGNQKEAEEAENLWTDEATALSAALVRAESLREITGGVRIERSARSWSTEWDRLVPSSARTELWSPGRWLTRDHGQGVQPIVNWCDAESRGVFSEAFLLGRNRPSAPEEAGQQPLYLGDHSLTPLHETYRHYRVAVERPGDDRAVLVLSPQENSATSLRFTIDTERHVVVRFEELRHDELIQTKEYSDFVEVAGSWWATADHHHVRQRRPSRPMSRPKP